jgi:hypothetical protein
MTVSWPEPNAKGELNVTRECAVLEEKVSSTHLVPIKSSGKKGTSSKITSWKINRKEATGGGGCWQHVKRNDMAPKSFYQFVCIRKIKSIEKFVLIIKI